MKTASVLYILYFLLQQHQLSAQNLTVKKVNYPGSSRVLYEYQILPNGINHGYFKEYTYDGLLSANYTMKFDKRVKGIHYYQDGKTVKHEFNQDENQLAHGIQKVNAFSSTGQLYTQHISNWDHGKLMSAKTMWNPADLRFKYDNGNLIRYKIIKGKSVICDKFSIDNNNLLTGYFREGNVNLHYSKGFLMKATLVDDSSTIIYTRINKDTLVRIFDIKSEDSTKWFYYFYDTTKLKAFITYNDEASGVSIHYIGYDRNNIIKYDAVDDHSETYDIFGQGHGENKAVVRKLYMYPNYPDNSGSYLRYWETKIKDNSEFFKSGKLFFEDGGLEMHALFKKLNDGKTEVFYYDKDGKLVEKGITD
jgi:hypothetical protein